MAESISIEAVSKEYPGGNVALNEVSLVVEPGSFVVLLGPSGSGKTTLLRCLAGIERLTAGKITIGNTTVARDQLHRPPDKRNLSMVFQDYALWPHLRVRDNVAFALRRSKLAKSDAQARTMAMLDRVGLGRLADRYPNELSGGEQQRVALARALVAGTGLILCDEPLSNLDADLRERMRVEISSLVREAGATAVYITHDQAEAFALADYIGLLQGGRLVQFGRPEQIDRRAGYAIRRQVYRALRRARGPARRTAGRRGRHSGDWPGWLRAAAPVPRAYVRVLGPPAAMAFCWSGLRAFGLGRPNDGDHHLVGTVADVAFRGRGYEHAIDIAGHGRLTGVFAPFRAERGDTVRLRLDPAGCHVFPAAAAQQPAATTAEPAAKVPLSEVGPELVPPAQRL